MNSLNFVLFGKNTLEEVELGYGALYRERWMLEQHAGPRLMYGELGGKSPKVGYLYPAHLGLLYERFGRANPDGLLMDVDDRIEAQYEREHGLTRQQADELTAQRRLFVTLTNTDEDLGYPHLKRYLPEIFLPEVVAAMEGDPWLDANLLVRAIGRGEVPDSRERHPRWSPEWRMYCDRLKSSAGLV